MKTLKLNKIIGLVFLIMMCSFNAYSHPGGLDGSLGHHDHKRGGYHYHCGSSKTSTPCFRGTIKPKPWYHGWVALIATVGGIFFWVWLGRYIDNLPSSTRTESNV